MHVFTSTLDVQLTPPFLLLSPIVCSHNFITYKSIIQKSACIGKGRSFLETISLFRQDGPGSVCRSDCKGNPRSLGSKAKGSKTS